MNILMLQKINNEYFTLYFFNLGRKYNNLENTLFFVICFNSFMCKN